MTEMNGESERNKKTCSDLKSKLLKISAAILKKRKVLAGGIGTHFLLK